MNADLTLGEYIRRLRRHKGWGLDEFAAATQLSVSHLSRIENDKAIPNADTVVKVANALGGELERMLQMADCLPGEILERLLRRVQDNPRAIKRSAGAPPADSSYEHALVEDIDPALRRALNEQFSLTDEDIDGLVTVLRRMKRMKRDERDAVIRFLANSARETPS